MWGDSIERRKHSSLKTEQLSTALSGYSILLLSLVLQDKLQLAKTPKNKPADATPHPTVNIAVSEPMARMLCRPL